LEKISTDKAMYYEVPKTPLPKILHDFLILKRKALDFAVKEGYFVIPTASGKSSMHLILEWLRFKGILTSRMDEIMVPPWMGAWVYKTMHSHGFPQMVLTPQTKVLWVYHQYGFPQDMDAIQKVARERNLIVIEDCAHAINSYYQDARLGTIGDFGIFSFSKFVPSLMGGAIVTKDENARDFFLSRIEKKRPLYSLFCFWSKYFDDVTHYAPLAQELLKTSYALYSYHMSMTRTVQNLVASSLESLNKRKENYATVKRILKGNLWIDSLETDILPYVVPIAGTPEELSHIVNVIKGTGLYSGLYHFDENRNLLEPRLISVAWLPIHQGIPTKIIEEVSTKIKEVLRPNS